MYSLEPEGTTQPLRTADEATVGPLGPTDYSPQLRFPKEATASYVKPHWDVSKASSADARYTPRPW